MSTSLKGRVCLCTTSIQVKEELSCNEIQNDFVLGKGQLQKFKEHANMPYKHANALTVVQTLKRMLPAGERYLLG